MKHPDSDNLDPFTERRLTRFVEAFRAEKAELPTLKDLETAGFTKRQVELALKRKRVVELYVTLTTGAVVKGYKVPN